MEERASDSDREAGDEIGIPPEVLARLKPAEERVLRYVVTNRDRVISDDELAEAVFERSLPAVATAIRQARFMAGVSVAKFGIMQAKFTHFRGQFTTGVRWTPRGE